MSTTVLEALQNAQINFETAERLGGGRNNPVYLMAKDQMKNAIQALENGMSGNDTIQESMFDEVVTNK